MSTAADRRSHARFPFRSRLEVRPRKNALADSACLATAIDVSVTGFGFRSPMPLVVGDVIRVTLPQVDGEDLGERTPTSLEILAVVRRVSQGTGGFVIGAERQT